MSLSDINRRYLLSRVSGGYVKECLKILSSLIFKKGLFAMLIARVFVFFLIFVLFPVNGYSNNHTVILRVVKVTPDWMPYASTDGWTQAVTTKESRNLKYFEVAIWEETSSIHLYEFPNDYNAFYGDGKTDQEKISYREQFAIAVADQMPQGVIERSFFVKETFKSFIDIVADLYPNSQFALSYSGHGSPGGELFENSLAPAHVQNLLNYWTDKIQAKLVFIDMGGPCNKGGYSDLNAFCPYADYYIASDLPNGGYIFDDWSSEKHNETNPDYRYHDLFENSNDIVSILMDRIDLKRKAYEYAMHNMIENYTAQANYLYSCDNFKLLYDLVEPIKGNIQPYTDLRVNLEIYGEQYINAFDSVIVHQADNRDFFDWGDALNWNFLAANGILSPNIIGFGSDLDQLDYPILIYPDKINEIKKRRSRLMMLILPVIAE